MLSRDLSCCKAEMRVDIKLRRADVDEVDGFQEGGIKKMWEMWERKKKREDEGEERKRCKKRERALEEDTEKD